MKKRITIVLLFLLSFFVLVQPLSAATKPVKLKVTLVRIELVENDHVGNEWYTAGYVNGKEIEEGTTVSLTLKSSDTLTLKGIAEEQDKIPESGTSTSKIKVSTITKTQSKILKVKVTENRGRYSGNSAYWHFTFKIEK
ncbi:hypothetical protein [Cohnella caldifontis]|uniref:hypothetical protein n=1 Tax=Cohnella caldifontis TaxID=3027471 RepID=UPI0023EB9152|nr:hypothetical protein [Cohnella sp. YIM B05605]